MVKRERPGKIVKAVTSPGGTEYEATVGKGEAGYVGVIMTTSGKFQPRLQIKGIAGLGCYDTAEEAAAVFCRAKQAQADEALEKKPAREYAKRGAGMRCMIEWIVEQSPRRTSHALCPLTECAHAEQAFRRKPSSRSSRPKHAPLLRRLSHPGRQQHGHRLRRRQPPSRLPRIIAACQSLSQCQ